MIENTETTGEEYTVDNIKYAVKDDKNVMITDHQNASSTVSVPDTVTINDNKFNVTSINSGAFQGCTDLNTVNLPLNITEIGDYAFESCANLKTITIPESVVSVGKNIFLNCSDDLVIYVRSEKMKNMLIASGVNESNIHIIENQLDDNKQCMINGVKYTVVGEESCRYLAISGCQNTSENIVLPEEPINIDNKLYTIHYIDDGAFKDCSNLKSITLSGTINGIGDCAFEGCTGLDSITIPNSVASIGKSAFADCTNLKTVNLPNDFTCLNENIFSGCSLLNKINLNNVSEIRKSAFEQCSSLKDIDLSNCELLGESCFKACTSLESVSLKEKLQKISSKVFANCSNLSTVLMYGDKLSQIGSDVFSSCSDNLKIFLKAESIKGALIDSGINESSIYGAEDYNQWEDNTTDDNVIHWTDDLCTIDGIKYKKNDNNSVSIINADPAKIGTSINIAESINVDGVDYTVSRIEEKAFSKNYDLINLVIPKTIKYVGNRAFYDCFNLEKVTILTEDAEMGDYVFYLDNVAKGTVLNETMRDRAWHSELHSATIVSQNTYTVVFNLSGGRGKTKLTANNGEAIQLPDNPTRNNCEFAGWYKDKELTEKLNDNEVIDTSMSLYAKWDEKVTSFDNWTASSCEKANDTDAYPSCIINGITFDIDDSNDEAYIASASDIGGKLVIPDKIQVADKDYTVTSVERYAFVNNNQLSSVVMPDTMKNLNECAFCRCTNLTHVDFSKNLESIGDGSFSECRNLEDFILPQNIKEISNNAFADCSHITHVEVPESIDKIAYRAFANCSNLESVKLPHNLKIIDNWAFYNCYNLKDINIEDTVEKIGDLAFYCCFKIHDIKLPDNLKVLGEKCFQSCKSITSINIPYNITSIGKYTFAYCENLKDIKLNNNITNINDYAFIGCISLENIQLPEALNEIGASAFKFCHRLKDLNFPASLTTIKINAFSGCSSFKNIYIPDTVKTIGSGVFSESGVENLVYPKDIQDFELMDHNVYHLKNLVLPDCVHSLSNINSDNVVIWTNNPELKYGCKYSAKYIIKNGLPLKINFDLNGGKGSTVLNFIESGEDIVMPINPVREGFVFNGWYRDSGLTEKFNSENGITENTVLYADWRSAEQPAQWDENNQCTADNIQYTFNHDNYVTVTGINADIEDVTIPSQITVGGNDYLVTSIGDFAFKECPALKNISMGENMYYIGYGAFSGCSNLANVSLPESLTAISPAAFEGCDTSNMTFILEDAATKDVLSTAGINSDNIEIAQKSVSESEYVIDGIKYAVNHDNYVTVTGSVDNEAEDILIPDTVTINGENYLVTSIGDYAFKNCRSVKNISIGNNVCYLGYCAFMNCSSLENINIPKAVTAIGDSAFEGCNMESLNFKIEDENTKEVLNDANIQNVNTEVK